MDKCKSNKRVAACWDQHREQLALSLHSAVSGARACAGEEKKSYQELDTFAQKYLHTAVDIAILWLRNGDPVFYKYFVGWVKFCSNERLRAAGPSQFYPDDVQAVVEQWLEIVRDDSIQCDFDELRVLLRGAERDICAVPNTKVRVLFIGDCLKDEIIAGLYGPCALDGISLEAQTLSQRVPMALRNEIKKLRGQQFDLIFYSPFSHAFSETFAAAVNPRKAFKKRVELDRLLQSSFDQTHSTLDLLGSLFKTPIYVHNTAAVFQHHSGSVGRFKLVISMRIRNRAIERAHRCIADYINSRKQLTQEQYILVDERRYLESYGAYKLGEVMFDSGDLHPTLLGSSLAGKNYYPAIYAKSRLLTKKLVVCDLDNTLWDGVIGEGVVKHFRERQSLLKKLKQKGVLLAINSKNDEKNIHWDGGILVQDDFVSSRINWGSKVANMRGIQDELNLKVKDFIFIDDRPDEREMVKKTYPSIQVMDPCDPDTWMLFEAWSHLLPEQSNQDRTQLYKQRAERDQFIDGSRNGALDVEDESKAFHALGLKVTISEVTQKELKRAAELINRTNQFNTCGTRTTSKELAERIKNSEMILQLEAEDKFGSMGMVGVMSISRRGDTRDIPMFVLSCRVFGFSIEHALLSFVQKQASGNFRITAQVCKTEHNKPCQGVYCDNGFEWDGSRWIWNEGKTAEYAAWLDVAESVDEELFKTKSPENE